MGQKPFQLLRVVDQFFIEKADIPPGNNIPDVEYYRVDFRNGDNPPMSGLTLTRFKPAIRFVDHIGAATTTDHAAVPMTVFERLQRVADFHFGTTP